MKKIKINIPEGTEYLSDIWDNFKNQFPSGHFILNKNVPGCGATEAFLRDGKTKTILASPRKQLLYNLKSATIIQYTIKGRFMSR